MQSNCYINEKFISEVWMTQTLSSSFILQCSSTYHIVSFLSINNFSWIWNRLVLTKWPGESCVPSSLTVWHWTFVCWWSSPAWCGLPCWRRPHWRSLSGASWRATRPSWSWTLCVSQWWVYFLLTEGHKDQ